MEVLGNAIMSEKELKYKDWKEEIKYSLIVDDMIVYVENSKDSTITITAKILDLKSDYSKVAMQGSYAKANVFPKYQQ